jgi:P27 family predicted phage terminase small subunit
MKNTTKPPSHLSEEAKKRWHKIFAEIDVADTAAVLLLDTLFEQWDRMQEARRAIAKDGATVAGRFGLKASPWVSIERDAAATVTRCWRLLGFDQQPPEGR